MSTRCPYGISGCSVSCCPTTPGTCTRARYHEGTCNGFPRAIEGVKAGTYCYTPREIPQLCEDEGCPQSPLKHVCIPQPEPAWVTALKTQLARVTEERDQARERAENCSQAVERLAVTLRAERAAHHD